MDPVFSSYCLNDPGPRSFARLPDLVKKLILTHHRIIHVRAVGLYFLSVKANVFLKSHRQLESELKLVVRELELVIANGPDRSTVQAPLLFRRTPGTDLSVLPDVLKAVESPWHPGSGCRFHQLVLLRQELLEYQARSFTSRSWTGSCRGRSHHSP